MLLVKRFMNCYWGTALNGECASFTISICLNLLQYINVKNNKRLYIIVTN